MRVMVEIHDSQIIEALRDAVRMRSADALKQHHPDDILGCVRICDHMNAVIEYFGGQPYDYSDQFRTR